MIYLNSWSFFFNAPMESKVPRRGDKVTPDPSFLTGRGCTPSIYMLQSWEAPRTMQATFSAALGDGQVGVAQLGCVLFF